MGVLYFVSMVLFLILCCILSFVILIQEAKSIGLGASFGGDVGDSLFGVSTPKVLKVVTSYLAVIFICSCILLSFWTGSRTRSGFTNTSLVQEKVG